jgi:hypothetical protein
MWWTEFWPTDNLLCQTELGVLGALEWATVLSTPPIGGVLTLNDRMVSPKRWVISPCRKHEGFKVQVN